MNAQILIKCGNSMFEFSKSKTGQIDYEGKWESLSLPDLNGYQELTSSSYFSPAEYNYIRNELNFIPKIYVAPEVEITDKDTYAYLVHIGPVLAAIEAKDSYLAGELYISRKMCFDNFAQLTQYIMEPLCTEILFSLSYGRMHNVKPEDIPLIYNSAKKKLNLKLEKENLDQAFIRYIKSNEFTVTMPLVGTDFYDWSSEEFNVYSFNPKIDCSNIMKSFEEIRYAKHSFYENLEVAVQAEPYNSHDKYSIIVYIDGIEAVINGNRALEKAGHIRAVAAKIIREAKEEKLSYKAELQSISNSNNKTVIKLTI